MTGKRIVFFVFVLMCSSLLMATRSLAQAVPDTSLKTVFPDTTKQTELRTIHNGINASDVSIDSNNTNVDTSHTAQVNGAPTQDTGSGDILPKKKEAFQPNPKKAGMYSAICPGLGQLYNRQYWKVPVVLVGIGVASYFISTNLNNYQTYRNAYISALSAAGGVRTDQFRNIYSTEQLQQLESQYEQYLDLTVLFTAVGYGLQVLDAITYAHLKNFDISRDLSMRMAPVAFPRGGGVGLVFDWK